MLWGSEVLLGENEEESVSGGGDALPLVECSGERELLVGAGDWEIQTKRIKGRRVPAHKKFKPM